jgi:hypothetical protein
VSGWTLATGGVAPPPTITWNEEPVPPGADEGWTPKEEEYSDLPATVYLAVFMVGRGTIELVDKDFGGSPLFPVSVHAEEATDQDRKSFWERNRVEKSAKQSDSLGDLTLVCGQGHSVVTVDVSYMLGGNPPPPQVLRDGLRFYTDRDHHADSLDVNEFINYVKGVKQAFPSLTGAENYDDDAKKQNSLLHTLLIGQLTKGGPETPQIDALEKILQLYEEEPEHLANMLCSTNTDDCTPLQLACEKKSDPMIGIIVKAACSALSAIKVQPLDDDAVKSGFSRGEKLIGYRVVYKSKPLMERLLRLDDLLYTAKVSQAGFLCAMQLAPVLKCPPRVLSRGSDPSDLTKIIGEEEWTKGSQVMTHPGLWTGTTEMPVRSMLGSLFYGLPKGVQFMLKKLVCVGKAAAKVAEEEKAATAATAKAKEEKAAAKVAKEKKAATAAAAKAEGEKDAAAAAAKAEGEKDAAAAAAKPEGEKDAAAAAAAEDQDPEPPPGLSEMDQTEGAREHKKKAGHKESNESIKILNPLALLDLAAADNDEPQLVKEIKEEADPKTTEHAKDPQGGSVRRKPNRVDQKRAREKVAREKVTREKVAAFVEALDDGVEGDDDLSEKDARLAQKLGQLQPLIASCIITGMHGRLAVFGPT